METTSRPGVPEADPDQSGAEFRSTAAGEVSVPVRPAGKLKRALRGRGKALARAKVEFAPADGTPRTQATPVKLKLRRDR